MEISQALCQVEEKQSGNSIRKMTNGIKAMGNHLSALLKWSNTCGALGKRGNMISLGVVAVFLVYNLIPKGC